MYNKVVMVGFLTRDVELRYMPSGGAVATIGIATNRRYKKQDGTQGEDTCFIDAQAFGRTAEVINQYLRKGSKILIEGKLVFQSWTDQQGQKRSRHIISIESMQMMDTKQETARQDVYQEYEYQNQQQTTQNTTQHAPQPTQGGATQGYTTQQVSFPSSQELEKLDEDIPF